jgi:hypothetical protein
MDPRYVCEPNRTLNPGQYSETWKRLNACVLGLVLLAGCGGAPARTPEEPVDPALAAEHGLIATAIGRGPEFHPPARPPRTCSAGPAQGRFRAHIELFGRREAVVVPAAIGLRPPFAREHHRIVGARCRADARTLEPTGVVEFDRLDLRLADVFEIWGEPLGPRRMASFAGDVSVFVAGRRVTGDPGDIPLRDGAQIVLQVGGYIPPHPTFEFPPRG